VLVVDGFASIYYDGSPGIAFSIVLSQPGNASGTVVVRPVAVDFVLSGTFVLGVNTTAIARSGIAPGLRIAVNDASVNLFGFVVSGGLVIDVSPSGLSITIPSSSPLTPTNSIKGLAKLIFLKIALATV